jgi:hypothetical protein
MIIGPTSNFGKNILINSSEPYRTAFLMMRKKGNFANPFKSRAKRLYYNHWLRRSWSPNYSVLVLSGLPTNVINSLFHAKINYSIVFKVHLNCGTDLSMIPLEHVLRRCRMLFVMEQVLRRKTEFYHPTRL